MYALPPNYAARATVWIKVQEHQVRDEGRFWSGQLPISSGWIDLIRTNIVLEEVARRERLYLVNVSGDSAALSSFAIKERVRPGRYLLAVDTAGAAFTLSGDAGAPLDGGAGGGSVGAPPGLAWGPPEGTRPGGRRGGFPRATPAGGGPRPPPERQG